MNNPHKNLYISDLDGTLLNHESRISDRSKAILTDICNYGAMFTIATARTPATVDVLMSGIPASLPAIVMTGAATWNLNRKRYDSYIPIDPLTCDVIGRICMEHGITPFRYTLNSTGFLDVYHLSPDGTATMNRAEQSFVDERRHLRLKQFHFSPPQSGIYNPTLLFLGIADINSIHSTAEELRSHDSCSVSAYPDIFNQSIGILEIYAPGVSKASAIKRLRRDTGASRLTVFGDNLNDIPMMEIADVAVAVDNALPQVKAAADIVIGPNTEDSVARYILADVMN